MNDHAMNFLTTLAYLDPGTGSMILQALIGGLLGGIYILKLYWHRIVDLCTGKKADDAEASGDD